jgi:DNA-binding beta-propeller fold protein YncE
MSFRSSRACLLAVALATTAAADEPQAPRIVAGGGGPGFADGQGAAARFHKPIRLAPLGPDAVVVADIFNHAIRRVRLDGTVTTLAGAPDRKGHEDGPAQRARFASPHGVAVSPAGVVAVAEAENHTIRLLTPLGAGQFSVSTLAGVPGRQGLADTKAGEALFRSPHAVIEGKDGSLVVADIGNARIRRIRDGRCETLAGEEKGTFTYPMDVAWAKDGTLLVADAATGIIHTVPAAGPVGSLKLERALATPHGIAVAPDGTLYVAEMGTHRVVAIGPDGRIRSVAGTGEPGAGEGQLNKPAAVLVHASQLWIADLDNHRIVVVPLRSQP